MDNEKHEIIFQCDNCKAILKTPEIFSGKEGICPNCNFTVTVPEKSMDQEKIKKE